jgi:hypothetical protein
MNPHERGRRNEAQLTYEYVASILEYDPVEDVLRWKVRRGGKARAGSVAGSIDTQGYWHIRINGVLYKGHRIAWLLHYRQWPTDQLDHIDGQRHRLAIENLREVSSRENSMNQKLFKTNTSGMTGVYWVEKNQKYRALIKVHGRLKHLGYFDTFEEAVAARRAAEIEYGFHPGHGLDEELRYMLFG